MHSSKSSVLRSVFKNVENMFNVKYLHIEIITPANETVCAQWRRQDLVHGALN